VLFDPAIAGTGMVTKTGTGVLKFTGTHSYVGVTTVAEGSLLVNGTIASGSDVHIDAGAALGGAGLCNGAVTAHGSVISPGDGGPGKLSIGSLSLANSSSLLFDLGTASDTIAVSGDLTLDGTINLSPSAGFASGSYTVITCAGILTNDTVAIGTVPAGKGCRLSVTAHAVTVLCTTAIITAEPRDTAIVRGTNGSISLSASGTGALTYQWIKDSSTSVGSTAGISFDSVAPADSGRYRCIVTDSFGADTSRWVSLSIIVPPEISSQPEADTVFVGARTRLGCSATGTSPLAYVWYKERGDADSIVAIGSDSLQFTATIFADSGGYYCIVGNAGGADTSLTVTLTVQPIPPSEATVTPDTACIFAGDTIRFVVNVVGTAPFTYAWYKERSAADTLLAATSDTLQLAPATLADSGRYYCVVRNPGGLDTSGGVQLIVKHAPPAHADIRPDSGTVFIGETVRFFATAEGTRPFSYQWFKAGTPGESLLQTGGDTLRLENAVLTDSGKYYCIVGNPGGTDTSDTARLIVLNAATPYEDTGFVNSIAIDTVYFDTLAALLRLSCCIDTAALPHDAQAGISYRLMSYPDDPGNCRIIDFDAACISAEIRPDSLRFDTLYYIALWFRTSHGAWRAPTVASRATVRIGRPFRQVITLFDPKLPAGGSVDVFNGSGVLWKDSSYTYTVAADTAELIRFDPVPEGMIVVGKPFRFRKAVQVSPLYLGMRIDSLPANRSIDDVRIYTERAGELLVNYETRIDPKRALVYVPTNDLRQPFIAMIDTSAPKTEISSDTSAFAFSTAQLDDTLRILDNIANVQWGYYYGRGDEPPQLRQQSESYHTGEPVLVSISDAVHAISSESGLRAYLVVTDGVHTDTINLSRSVLRPQSDNLTTEPNIWTPVYPTAVLFDKAGDSLIARLSDHDTAGYDERYMRLFRWVGYGGNKDDDVKWVEYDPDRSDIRSLFTLEPGRILWLKTLKDKPIHLDSGYTLSLKDTFTLELPAEQWTDFGMPYRFGVRMEEILSASGPAAESVLFYQWKRDSVSRIYLLEPLYVPGMPDKVDRLKIVEYVYRGGYSFYNRSSSSVTLRIPPTLPSMAQPLAVAKKLGVCWSAKFKAQSACGTELPAVYFGYAAGIAKSAYPLSPAFETIRLSIFDRSTNLRYGHFIGEDAKEGLVRELQLSNDADTARTIRYRLETAGAFPETYSVYCFDASLKKPDTAGMITIAPRSTVSRWIMVGDAAYCDNFLVQVLPLRYSLHTLYPNPARSVVNIRYTVPLGAQERIRIAIYTMLGKRVWEKRIDDLLTEGEHVTTWNGADHQHRPAGSGLYIVRMTVADEGGKPIKRFDQRVTLIR